MMMIIIIIASRNTAELAERGCHGDDVHTKLQLLIVLSTSHIIQQGFICSQRSCEMIIEVTVYLGQI